MERELNELRGWMESITGSSERERVWSLTWREIRVLEREMRGSIMRELR